MIMFSMLSLLFLCHCFLLFYCCFFSLYLPMPLLLHIVFCYYYHYCCMRVVVIINIVVRMVVVVIIIIIIIIIIIVVVVVFIALLLPIQHLCFIPFYGLLISLSLSPHGTSVITYSIVLLYFTLFYRALSSYSFLRMRFSYEWYE